MNKQANLAFLFPGQGSQTVGMLSEYADNEIVKSTFTAASQVLGYDLWQLAQEGPQEKINQTEITQPLLLTASVALWRVWQDKTDVVPSFVAGHSLGEWSALVCAGVVAFEDAVRLVQLRGRYMQEAVPQGEGAMAAIIGLDDNVVEDICADIQTDSAVVAPVNYNSPGQLVIAGAAGAVEKAIAACKEAGAKRALPLPVSAPFHTLMMKPAAEKLAEQISTTTFNTPQIGVVHNVTAGLESDAIKIKDIMIQQIYGAVRWVECVQFLVKNGVDTAVECGAGKVLTGLSKRIDRSINSYTTDSVDALNATLESVATK
ncbi:Malonyl CoA-acyl carrier protein transacylase [Thalassocella blandensis]|nr:Malonyl CoA-acyl carrier protein transacylase [Thalassocella blandensis]